MRVWDENFRRKIIKIVFCGRELQRSKAVISKIIQKVSSFIYSGCCLMKDKRYSIKIFNILKVADLISAIFKRSEVQKHTGLRICDTLALPMLLYGSENCTMNVKVTLRITVTETRCMRRTEKCTRTDYRRYNTKITKNGTYIGQNYEI
jgi:hypothetical protein